MTELKILRRSFFCAHRFCLTEFQTRFGSVEWHITDSDTVSDADVAAGKLPETVYQGDYTGALAFIKLEQDKLYDRELAADQAAERKVLRSEDRRIARNKARRERDQARRDCGLVKVRGNLGGTYWE